MPSPALPGRLAAAALPLLLALTACNSARSSTSSAPDVRGGELDPRAPAARAEELMDGRFPGVQVVRLAGGGIAVRVRGATSIMGSNEPLYVLDGMTLEPGPGGALLGINPADIARIEVLKDIGSTSMYGVRGANGVVLITTRKQ